MPSRALGRDSVGNKALHILVTLDTAAMPIWDMSVHELDISGVQGAKRGGGSELA